MTPYHLRGYWADVGTIDSFYDANILLTQRGAPFNFFHPRRPIYTHPRFLPGTRAARLPLRGVDLAEGATWSSCEIDRVDRRHPDARRARRDASRDRCCSAPTSTRRRRRGAIPLGIGQDVVLDRVIVDKNARIGEGVRLVNERASRMSTATAITSAAASSSCRKAAS